MIFFKDKIKYQYYFLSSIFSLMVIVLVIFLLNSEKVLALSSNYGKSATESLSTSEWNEIANDFLAKSGGVNGVMSGILDMGLSRISNVGNPTNNADIANKSYISSSLSSLGGGSVFTNWGRSDCPTGSEELYEGFAFGSGYDDEGGGNNVLCLKSGGAGISFTGFERSQLYPLTTVNYPPSFPSEITKGVFIRCAVCYNSNSSCYIKVNNRTDGGGNWLCDGSYTVAYEGYLGGAIRTAGSNLTTRDRQCINRNFDGATVPATTPSASRGIVHGTMVRDNLGLTGYNNETFIRCSVCCN